MGIRLVKQVSFSLYAGGGSMVTVPSILVHDADSAELVATAYSQIHWGVFSAWGGWDGGENNRRPIRIDLGPLGHSGKNESVRVGQSSSEDVRLQTRDTAEVAAIEANP
jgi:hypothetical protein